MEGGRRNTIDIDGEGTEGETQRQGEEAPRKGRGGKMCAASSYHNLFKFFLID